jgi:hypothetical protein
MNASWHLNQKWKDKSWRVRVLKKCCHSQISMGERLQGIVKFFSTTKGNDCQDG